MTHLARLLAALALAAAPAALAQQPTAPPAVSDIDGLWAGTLHAGAVSLRLVLHITGAPGDLRATMDSPDQNANGIPATSVRRDGATLDIAFQAIGAKFSLRLDGALSTLSGTLTQAGAELPLEFKRVRDAASLETKRPQTPVKPYPYREEEVSYENPAPGIRLGASLTLPPGKGPFAAVVLITGSGAQDRDESLFGHKPFLVLADALTRRGIAVLRSDDRGVGKSTGNFAAATTADFATDTEAAVAWLKTRTEIDPRRIGLLGHSEGGVIAPMIAARNSAIAFIVLLAGPGVRGDELLVAQVEALAEASGATREAAARSGTKEREILSLVESEKDNDKLEKLAREKLGTVTEQELRGVRMLGSPWFRYFLAYDPAPALTKVKCPVLALNGGLDRQVPPALNLPAIRKALQTGGNKRFEVVEMPGLNHLFQTAKTGAVAEYGAIEQTMAPEALEKIASWISTVSAISALNRDR